MEILHNSTGRNQTQSILSYLLQTHSARILFQNTGLETQMLPQANLSGSHREQTEGQGTATGLIYSQYLE